MGGEIVLRLESVSETDRDNAPPNHIGERQRARAVGMMPGASRRRGTVEGAVHAVRVVIIRECVQLSRQVGRVPEEHVIEIFAADGADQPFDERMRNWGVRSRLDLSDRQDAQVC